MSVTSEPDFFDGTGHRVLRARAWILRVSLGLVAVGWLIGMDLRLVVMFATLAVSLWVPPMVKPDQRVLCAVYLDSTLAIALWWMFGPTAGPDFILVILAAIAGLVLTGSARKQAVLMILIAEVIQIPLHIWVKSLDDAAPLFHPSFQVVGEAEFIVG
ncbi:MAG: hypothetical protein KY394_08015, partial [Actinobacteria bacterium]|nr:hypothetical protein [Actinomycetota bacterium]